MTDSLALVPQAERGQALISFDDTQIQTMRDTIVKGASQEQFHLFLQVCQATGLNPFARQIYAVIRKSRKQGEPPTMAIQVGIDGYRLIAERTGLYAGQEGPYWCGADGEWKDIWLHAEPPTAAKVGVWRRGFREPVWGKALYREFVQTEAKWQDGQQVGRHPTEMWRTMPANQLAKCFDEETEVLTDRGFERFAEVTGRILQVTEHGLEPTSAVPFWKFYAGPMVGRFSQALDFCVTPDHELLTQEGKVSAANVLLHAWRYRIPLTVSGSQPEFPVSDAALRLAGMIVADGTAAGDHQYRVEVSRPYKVEALTAVGLHERSYVRPTAGDEVVASSGRTIRTISNKVGFSYRRALTAALLGPNKCIRSETILRLSQRQARLFIDAWALFDGHTQSNGVTRLSTSRRDHLQALEVAAIVAGYAISRPKPKQSDIGRISYTVTLISKDSAPVRPNLTRRANSAPQWVPSTGRVWCVTVPSHLIVVRRRGLSMVTGQCAEAQALRRGFGNELAAFIRDNVEIDLDDGGRPYDAADVVVPAGRRPIAPPQAMPTGDDSDVVVDTVTGEIMDPDEVVPPDVHDVAPAENVPEPLLDEPAVDASDKSAFRGLLVSAGEMGASQAAIYYLLTGRNLPEEDRGDYLRDWCTRHGPGAMVQWLGTHPGSHIGTIVSRALDLQNGGSS